jgi:hypothetical protein
MAFQVLQLMQITIDLLMAKLAMMDGSWIFAFYVAEAGALYVMVEVLESRRARADSSEQTTHRTQLDSPACETSHFLAHLPE